MTFPPRLSFSAQLSNCNRATCWHIELSILGLLHDSISIHLRISFRCFVKFFWLNISFGLFLAQPQKSIDVYKGLLPREGLPRQTWQHHLRRNKDVNSWIKFRLYSNFFVPSEPAIAAFGETQDVNSSIKFIQQFFWTSLGRSLCHGNEHHGIDPSIFSSGPSWLFHQRLSFSAQLTNCNVGTCWHVRVG